MNRLKGLIEENIGLSFDTQENLFWTLVIILVLFVLRIVILRIVWKRTKNVKYRYQWKRTISLVIPLLGLIIIIAVWASVFDQFGAFLGLFAAGIAIALKDPLTNLAGWIFILIRKPFVVGDRVQIGENTGDIVDIRLFQFTMLEIGNWVDADQSTGRIVHLPNGKVFTHSQANYSTGFEYIWHEIKVVITFESNWKEAKKILESVMNEQTRDIHIKAEKEIHEASKNYMIYYKHLTPIIYTDVQDHGVRLTLRYLCNPRSRRGTENAIWEEILLAFDKHKDIDFAYPTTRFYKQGEE